jgi:hypothetical protein
MIAIGAAALVLIGLAAALAAVLASSGSGGGGGVSALPATMRAAGCTYSTVKSSPPNQHLQDLAAKVKYNSFPPTSGWHYVQWARWGNYSQLVNPRQAVHNEEHGGIIVWYGPKISAAEREKINQFYDESPEAILVTPIADTTRGITYPKHQPIGSKVAITAWYAPDVKGIVSICPGVDLPAFEAFRDALRGNGPERIPLSQLQPNT